MKQRITAMDEPQFQARHTTFIVGALLHRKLAQGWRQFLYSRHAPVLTHASLALLTLALLLMLWRLPFWLAFVPGVILGHRVGVLLHEYIHGIPFRRYRHSLWVLSFFDGLLLLFGMLELFRATHLAHHRWLNTEQDPAFQAAKVERTDGRAWKLLFVTEGMQHLQYLGDYLRGRHPYVRPRRILLGAVSSLLWIVFWTAVGRTDIVLKMLVLIAYTTLVPVSLRGAVEHHSHPGDPDFANEYKVMIPLFNLNRHRHHHENSRLPWYLLEFRTPSPLGTRHYLTYWFYVYLKRNYVLMQPMPRVKVSARN